MEYDHITAYLTLCQIAFKNNTTIDRVIIEIEDAIAEAYDNALITGNSSVLARWNSIPSKNQIPSAIELVSYLGKKIKSAL